MNELRDMFRRWPDGGLMDACADCDHRSDCHGKHWCAEDDCDCDGFATFDPQLVGALLDVAEAAHNAYVECSCLWTGGTHETPRRTFVCASCRLEEQLDALDALTEEA